MPGPVRITNEEKVLYPASGTTKGEVVEYYRRIAPVLLPHLRGRAVTLRRFPDGVEGESFFEKRCPGHRPSWVQTATVTLSSGRSYQACTVEDAETIVWMANLAALELHPSLARAERADEPTVMVFDLDPGAPAAIGQCAEVACALRTLLAQLELECVAKTSGSKGMQVYVPLNSAVDFRTTKLLSHSIALLLQGQLPKLVVTVMAKDVRRGRVFIDWSQNDRAKTTVSVYSLRARPSPTVSTPLLWDEVEQHVGAPADALVFGPAAVLERVDRHGDLFAPAVDLEQDLPPRVVDLLVKEADQ